MFAATTIVPFFVAALAQESSAEDARPYLDAALSTARWLDSVAVERPGGIAWPADPTDPDSVSDDLYSGSAGVVLFYLELYAATDDPHWLARAQSGTDVWLEDLDRVQRSAGLYTGAAGLGYALAEVARSSPDPRYRTAAIRTVDDLVSSAKEVGAGVEWEPVTDIISGAAGTGLFLLWASSHLGHPAALEVATRVGDRLLELGPLIEQGRKWAMSADFPRTMPNFSHGTAGIAYFLARLHAATGEPRFLQGAVDGVRYLDSIADRSDDGYLVFHHEPEGEDLFYLGWCHGPAGTMRLFFELWMQTGEKRYLDRIEAEFNTLHHAGIPQNRPPGFWNTVGQCCGSAGVAESLLDFSRSRGPGDPFVSARPTTAVDRDLALARSLTTDLLARATNDAEGMRWVQAEHRVRPDLLVAQTGYAQGAAGIGLWLLHFDAAQHGRTRRIVLPDSPF